MPAPDPLRIVEASYTWAESEPAWLGNVLAATAPYDRGGGFLACTVDFTDPPRLGALVGHHADTAACVQLTNVVASLSTAAARAAFAPTEFVGNAAWRMNRLARAQPPGQPPPVM